MTSATRDLHLPAGSTSRADVPARELDVTPESAGWDWSGLALLRLTPGQSATVSTGGSETLVLPLQGSCTVTLDGTTLQLAGRRSVFDGPTDFVYVPRDVAVEVTSAEGGRFALPSARCEARLPCRHHPADKVPVELRGAGRASRQVNNFCTPDAFEADRLIACEVLTPAGNW